MTAKGKGKVPAALRLPIGVRTLLFEEAARLRSLESSIVDSMR